MTRFALLVGLLPLAGCIPFGPYDRVDAWQPEGAPAGDLAVQVANPYDLIRGQDDRGRPHYRTGDAVQAVWDDRAKALPGRTDTGSINVNLNNAGGSAGSAAPP